MTIYTDGYIEVQGKRYECTQKLKEKLSYCTNMKEYVEAAEYLAFEVFVNKTKENEDWFREV